MRTSIYVLTALAFAGCAGDPKVSEFLGRFTGQLRSIDTGAQNAAWTDVVYGAQTDLALVLGEGCTVDIIEDSDSGPGQYLFSQARATRCPAAEGSYVDIDLLNGTIAGDVLSARFNWLQPGVMFSFSFVGTRE